MPDPEGDLPVVRFTHYSELVARPVLGFSPRFDCGISFLPAWGGNVGGKKKIQKVQGQKRGIRFFYKPQ
jgi:hypothetical protein